MANFSKSLEFQHLLLDSTMKYYYHGYRTCASQFADAGYPPLTGPIDFLDIHAGLADAPESDEEVPYELPEPLLDTAVEGEAPKDPRDQMIDIFPPKVAPLAGGD
ncbi:UNVERIFIED_CONTAM: hypothetical protein Slati_0930900 [Sesamum latifolium]|uniref:Uncharacterized protein n=1 Tax=Sesamum latifolium TaxID=2727402 RepID=A0AAW2XPE6_9LAMI